MIQAVEVTRNSQLFETLEAECFAFEKARGNGKDAKRYALEPLRRNGKDWLVLPDGFVHKNAMELPEAVAEEVELKEGFFTSLGNGIFKLFKF